MNIDTEDIVVLGLSLSSSWGNGHATTYRALLRGLAELGRRVLFLERDVPWYAAHRDLPRPDFCELGLYTSRDELRARFGSRLASAGAVIVGSYVPDGIDVIDDVLAIAGGVRGFYDIDTPVTLAALDRGELTYLAARQIPEFDFYLSFSGGPILQRLASQYGARRPIAFYCAVDDTRYRPGGGPVTWDMGYLGTYSPDRQPAVERLLLEPARRLPQCRFVVAGPQYPAGIAWPANVERIEHLPPKDHAAFYAAQRFTLNVTRADMVEAGWSPSVRLFEAAACGTPIISDRWPGLTDLFPDAVVIADRTEHVVGALTELPEAAHREMARRARDIVLREHTGAARARALLHVLADRRNGAAAPPLSAARSADPSTPARPPAQAHRAHRPASRAVLVTGAAGFLGSHLCDLLIAEGSRVIGLDNLQTGVLENLATLQRESRFSLIEAHIAQPLPRGLAVDRIINLACTASSPQYQARSGAHGPDQRGRRPSAARTRARLRRTGAAILRQRSLRRSRAGSATDQHPGLLRRGRARGGNALLRLSSAASR